MNMDQVSVVDAPAGPTASGSGAVDRGARSPVDDLPLGESFKPLPDVPARAQPLTSAERTATTNAFGNLADNLLDGKPYQGLIIGTEESGYRAAVSSGIKGTSGEGHREIVVHEMNGKPEGGNLTRYEDRGDGVRSHALGNLTEQDANVRPLVHARVAEARDRGELTDASTAEATIESAVTDARRDWAEAHPATTRELGPEDVGNLADFFGQGAARKIDIP